MIHSRDGARVAIYSLWYGTNKDRKLLIRSLKSFVVKIAKEEQGYPVLWTIFDIVDDTKLVSKIVLQELMSNFDEIINDPHGKKVLMYLIAPRNTKHLQYDLVQLMKTSDALNTSKKMRIFVKRNYLIIVNHIFWNILLEIFFQHYMMVLKVL